MDAIRGRNWLALTLGTVVLVFSYFSYAAAFVPAEEGSEATVELGLLGIALAIAPFVFVVVGFVSRNARTPSRVLISMGLLLVIGLSVGLLSPVLGASAGFGVGIALTLNLPEIPDQMRRRILAVTGSVMYVLVLLVLATPAGVLTGALLPPLMVGFADEYGAWQWVRRQATVGES